jgi:hypothetical protein
VHKFSVRDERDQSEITRIVDQIMLIEVKTFGAIEPFAQNDTHRVVDAILRKATVTNQQRRRVIVIPDTRPGRIRAKRHVRWFGVHLLQLSSDRPDTSDRIIWDGRWSLKLATLIEVIRFDRDPDNPRKLLDTRRHHRRPTREHHPDLFAVK